MLLGKHYLTEHKCSEFTTFIDEVFKQELVEAVNNSLYLSILVGVLSDITATEQEIIYILCLIETGGASCKFL